MALATIRVEGMHCDGCAQRLQRVLQRAPGVTRADVSLAARQARVLYRSEAVSVAHLREVIARAGFTADPSTGAGGA